jgi:hypothetical protein
MVTLASSDYMETAWRYVEETNESRFLVDCITVLNLSVLICIL